MYTLKLYSKRSCARDALPESRSMHHFVKIEQREKPKTRQSAQWYNESYLLPFDIDLLAKERQHIDDHPKRQLSVDKAQHDLTVAPARSRLPPPPA